MEDADIIINNNRQFNMGLSVIIGYLSQHLTTYKKEAAAE